MQQQWTELPLSMQSFLEFIEEAARVPPDLANKMLNLHGCQPAWLSAGPSL